MLQTQTVESGTLSLLKEIMELPFLQQGYLVGGTALSLTYGHRISVDLDIFINENWEREVLWDKLSAHFQTRIQLEGSAAKWAIFCFIDGVKVDFIHYPHAQIAEPNVIEGIRMYHTNDIVAMKINAILGRGKKKDFWDIAELTKYYSVQDMIALHAKKYPNQFLLISIPQVLTYFTDADDSEDPVSLNGQTWEGVKQTIRKAVREYLS
jgi:predicted nucleotidyltransferase component of viral defense system